MKIRILIADVIEKRSCWLQASAAAIQESPKATCAGDSSGFSGICLDLSQAKKLMAKGRAERRATPPVATIERLQIGGPQNDTSAF
jgi:hypothetical protein